jgi:hypothetical protein
MTGITLKINRYTSALVIRTRNVDKPPIIFFRTSICFCFVVAVSIGNPEYQTLTWRKQTVDRREGG